MSKSFDLIVIGSGPGGYIAALRAARLGMQVAVVEKEKTLGGTCLNVGCIPSKALLHSSEYFERVAKEGLEHGIEAKELKVNFERMMQRKAEVVHSLTQGIEFLFKKNKVQWIQGEGRFVSPQEIEVGSERFSANNFIIATGSTPIQLPFLPVDEKTIVTSTGVLSLKEVPKELVVVGAGVIGLELGSVYRRLGSQVTFVEMLDRVAPGFDLEISKNCEQILKKQGLNFYLNAKAKAYQNNTLLFEQNGKEEKLSCDVVLVCIGRKPYTEGLSLEKAGIQLNDKGQIPVEVNFQTEVPHIYAIGDVIDGPMLAHKAEEEGVLVADYLAQNAHPLNYLSIPNVMYTWPEVATVGLSEEEVKKLNREYLKASLPFKGVPRARCSGDTEGFVKILADKKTHRILGLHLLGPNVSEMIGEGVIAIKNELTLEDLAHASHAHPTCSEAIKEIALVALGMPLNSA